MEKKSDPKKRKRGGSSSAITIEDRWTSAKNKKTNSREGNLQTEKKKARNLRWDQRGVVQENLPAVVGVGKTAHRKSTSYAENTVQTVFVGGVRGNKMWGGGKRKQ